MNIKESIIEYAKQIGVDAIGFCKAEADFGRLSIYQERKEKGYACQFEDFEKMDLKVQPDYWLNGAKTFIVILEGYSLDTPKQEKNPLSVKLSKAAISEDYHKLVHRKLDKLSAYITTHFSCQTRSFCDNQGFSDRHIAQKAGLGVIGKNSFLINEQFGTSAFIGYLLTDLEIEEYDQPISLDYCNNCVVCIEACPGKAILPNKQINANTCISFLTQAKALSDEEKKKISNHLYGCDICQLVCPYNKRKHYKAITQIVDEYLDIDFLLNMNNEVFNDTLKNTAAGWRGKKHLQRNAIIALGNMPSVESVRLLNTYYNDSRRDIRMEIVHSLGRIGSKEALEVLSRRYPEEKDESIKKLMSVLLD